MLVGGQITHFLEEALAHALICQQVRMGNLDDDLAFELIVPGEVDRAHATVIEGFLNLVSIIESLANERIFVGRFGNIFDLVQAR